MKKIMSLVVLGFFAVSCASHKCSSCEGGSCGCGEKSEKACACGAKSKADCKCEAK